MRIECLLFVNESFGDADELRSGLSREYVVTAASTEPEARALLGLIRFDVVIVMTGGPRVEVSPLLEWVSQRQPSADRLLLHRSEDGSIASDFSAAGFNPGASAPTHGLPPSVGRSAGLRPSRWPALRGAERHRLS